MSIRLGIIGGGAIGKNHIKAAKEVGVEVACLADTNEQVAKTVAAQLVVPRYVTDPAELINDDQIDAVIIGVPNKFHAPLAVAAMQAGKDVLIEKPMARTAAECAKINEVAEQTGRICQVGYTRRFAAASQTARQYVQGGRLGRVYHVKANYYRRRGVPGLGGWFTTKEMSGGGPLIDIGVHVLDLVMYLLDFPTPQRVSGKVYANFAPRMGNYVYESMWAGPTKTDGVCDVEDSAHALIRLEGGVTLELNTTWAGNFPDNSVTNLIGLFGDQGGVTFQLSGDEVRLAGEDLGHNVDVIPKLRKTHPFEEQMKHFAECVEHRRQPIANGRQGQIIQAMIDAIYRSSEQDREVDIEL